MKNDNLGRIHDQLNEQHKLFEQRTLSIKEFELKISANISEKEIPDVFDFFAPVRLILDGGLNVLSHPKPAINCVLGNLFLKFKVNGKLNIDVGRDVRRLDQMSHSCYKIDARDSTRLVRCANEEAIGMYYGEISPFYCQDGVENCIYQAETMTLNHVYMSIDALAQAMFIHGTVCSYLNMFLPDLYYSGLQGFDKRTGIGIVDDQNLIAQSMHLFASKGEIFGSKLYMFFDDSSMPYVHNKKEWMEWYTCAGKCYPEFGFNLIIEKFRNMWGSYQIQVTVDKRGGLIPYHIEDKSTPYRVVFDVTSIADTLPKRIMTSGEIKNALNRVDSVVIPAELYDKIMQFIVSKADKSIDRQFVSAYLRSENQSIRLGGQMIKDKFDLNSEQSNILIKNMYVQACFDRMVQTKEIGSSFDGRAAEWSYLNHCIATSFLLTIIALLFVLFMSDECHYRYSEYPFIHKIYSIVFLRLEPFHRDLHLVSARLSASLDFSFIDDFIFEQLLLTVHFSYYMTALIRSLPLILTPFGIRVSLPFIILLNFNSLLVNYLTWYDYFSKPYENCVSYFYYRLFGWLVFVAFAVTVLYLVREKIRKLTKEVSWGNSVVDYRYSNVIQRNTHLLMQQKINKGDKFGTIELQSHELREVEGAREYNVIVDPCSTPGACLLEALSIVLYNDRKIIPELYESHIGDIPPCGLDVGVIDLYRRGLGVEVGRHKFGDGRIKFKVEEGHVSIDNPCCVHGVGYEPLNVWNKTVAIGYRRRSEISARGFSDHTRAFFTNVKKADGLKHLFQKNMHVACAAPGNDLKQLVEFEPTVSTYYKNKNQIERLKHRCYVLGLKLDYRNVCCHDCMTGFEMIYADVGSGGDLERLVALQYRTLENLFSLSCKFTCKIQNFIGAVVGGVPGMNELLDLMNSTNIRYTCTMNPNEIVVNNMGYGDFIHYLTGQAKTIDINYNEPKVISVNEGIGGQIYDKIEDLSVYGTSGVDYDKVIQAFLQLKSELQTPDDEFKELNDKVIEKLTGETTRRRIKTLRVLNTPAGGGKTTKIIEYCKKNQNCVVITPYKRLKVEYTDNGIESYTMVAGMLQELRGKTVFLDEYYAYSPGIAAFYFRLDCNLILAGDPYQNSFHDENNIYDGLSVRDFYHRKCESRTNISYSVPHDVIRFLNECYDYKAVTKSKVINSVSYHSRLEDIKNFKELPIFCFSKSKKNALLSRGLNANTVAAIQGVRVKQCILVIDGGNPIINSVPGQVVVGLTRHTEKLFVVGNHGKANVIPINATFGGLKIRENRLLDDFVIEIGEKFKVRREEDPVVIESPASHHINLRNYANIDLIGGDAIEESFEDRFKSNTFPFHMNTQRIEDPIVVEEIMARISPSSLSPFSEIYYVQHRNMPSPDKPMVIDMSKIEEPRDVEVTRITGALRGRPNHSRNSLQSIYTMISRYGLNKERPSDAHTFADELFEAWCSFTGVGYNAIPIEDLQRGVMEQVRCIAEKKEAQDEMLEDDVGKIKFFLKTQTKADLKPDSWIRMKPDGTTKGGQGISAQPKSVNHIFGPYVRAIENILREKMNARIFLGYGRNHHVLSSEISDTIKEGKPVFLFQGDDVAFYNGINGFELDISEQDRMRGYWSDLFMRKIYGLFGVPQHLVKLVEKHNVKWRLQGKEASVIVDECFQSGRADTLLSNTLVSMALFALHFKFIKGRICEVRHHEDLKVENCIYPSFVGHIVTPEGLVIDVPRMVAKLVNRNLSSCYEEYRLAVMDWCSKITEDNYHQTIIANAFKYGLPDVDVESLVGFLYSFVEGKIYNVNSNRGNCLINEHHSMIIDL